MSGNFPLSEDEKHKQLVQLAFNKADAHFGILKQDAKFFNDELFPMNVSKFLLHHSAFDLLEKYPEQQTFLIDSLKDFCDALIVDIKSENQDQTA